MISVHGQVGPGNWKGVNENEVSFTRFMDCKDHLLHVSGKIVDPAIIKLKIGASMVILVTFLVVARVIVLI